MSFLVVFNGQFSPLVHPNTAPLKTRVQPISGPSSSHEVAEFKDLIDEVLPESIPAKSHLKKLSVYQEFDKSFSEQRKRYYAKDIMTSPVKVIPDSASLTRAQELLQEHRFRHLPVVNNNGIIVGMISDRELLGPDNEKTCQEVMLQKIIVAEEQASITEIAIILLREKINALPIVNHNRELTGIITQSNILQFVVESTPFLGKA